MGTTKATFLGFSMAGGLLWSGTGIGIGAYFHTSVAQVLGILSTMGTTALIVLGVLLGLFVTFKYVERKRFHQATQMDRITIDELKSLLDEGHAPVLVDARSATAQSLEPAVPGALLFKGGAGMPELAALDKDSHIIVYCSCPNDVTAAQVAKELLAHGFHRARPLHGGLEAWNAAFAPAAAASPVEVTEGVSP
jgi:rhodanese-related sulfurtransferase